MARSRSRTPPQQSILDDMTGSHRGSARASSRRQQSSRPGARLWGSRVVIAVNLGVLAVGIAAFAGAIAAAPALSPSLRVGPLGFDWRPLSRPAFYDYSEYLVERAFALVGGREGQELDEGELAAALVLAMRAVEAAPADAYKWTLLAALAGTAGFDDAARAALARSVELAPINAALAIRRLQLFDLNETPLSDEALTMVERDLAVAKCYSASELRAVLEENPAIKQAVSSPAPPDDGRPSPAG